MAVLALWSWAAGVGDLLTFDPNRILMAPGTAICLILAGLTVLARGYGTVPPAVSRGVSLLAFLMAVAGAFAALRPWLSWTSPFELWLSRAVSQLDGVPIGQMAPLSGLLFLACGVAGCLLPQAARSRAARRGVQILSGFIMLIAAGRLWYYLLGKPCFFEPVAYQMAAWTSFAFLVLGAGLSAVLPLARTEPGQGELFSPVLPPAPGPGRTAITALAAVLLGILSAIYLRHEQIDCRNDGSQLLAAVGKLKQGQIMDWRAAHLNAIRNVARADFLSADTRVFLANPDDVRQKDRIHRVLRMLRENDRYSIVALFDTNDVLRLALPGRTDPALKIPRDMMDQALARNDVIMCDLHRDGNDPAIYQDIVMPVAAPPATAGPESGGNSAPFALVFLRLDASQFFHSLLDSWPVPSPTARTLMFRQENHEFIFVNGLPTGTNGVVSFRLPAGAAAGVPAVRAALSGLDQFEGRDNRNVQVLTVVHPVAGMDWFLATQMDHDEVYARMRGQAWMALLLTALITAATGLTVGFVAKRREAGRALQQLGVQRRQLELAQRLNYVMEHANDAILLTDRQGVILEANQRAEEFHGYSLAELRTMTVALLRAPDGSNGGTTAADEDAVYETLHRRKDGSVFPVDVSSRTVEIGGVPYRLDILRDATQRKAQQREIERLSRLYATLSQVNQTIVRCESREELFADICRVAVKFGPFSTVSIGWREAGDDSLKTVAREVAPGAASDGSGIDCGCNAIKDVILENRPCLCNGSGNEEPNGSGDDGGPRQGRRPSAAFPLRLRDRVCGAFCVGSATAEAFHEEEVRLLEEIASDISFALDKLDKEEERRRTANALQAGEARWRSFVENIPERIFVKDRESRYIFINGNYARDLGISAQSVVGKSSHDFFPRELADKYRADDLRVIEGGRTEELEEKYVRNGKEIWVHTIKTPLHDHDGAIIGLCGIFHDITERKHAETVLLEREEQLRLYAEHSPLAVAMFDRDMKYLVASRRWIEDYRLGGRVLVGRCHYDVVPDIPQRWREVYRRCLAGKVERCDEDVYVRADGSVSRLRWEVRPWNQADGSVGGVIIFSEDITTRKQAEESLKLFRTLIDRCNDGIYVIDPKSHRFLDVNESGCRSLGYTREELLALTVFDVKAGLDRAVYDGRAEDVRLAAGGTTEALHRRKDGSMFPVEVSLSVVRLDREYQVAVVRDITERRQLEAEFRQAQKMEAIGQLAGGVAHDFNNILAAAMLNLALLRGRSGISPEDLEALDELASLNQRAATLTRQLLLFSRRSLPHMQTLDLNEAVENLLKMLRRLIGEQITLDWRPQPQLPCVDADTGMIEQLILNLVVNARDALTGGGMITLSTSAVSLGPDEIIHQPDARPGRFVRLTVTDNGCGMSDTVLRRIFEPFFTTKEPGKGTGLGLATVYGITRQHQGWVTVESQVGRGSSFHVFLPACGRVIAAATPAADSGPLRGGCETILFVEDDPGLRKSLSALLRQLGYHILEAGSASEARRLWETARGEIRLLYTDMVMPEGTTGLELAQQLRAVQPDLPVIISSGYSIELLQTDRLATQNIHYLPKPSPSTEIAALLRRCLDQPA